LYTGANTATESKKPVSSLTFEQEVNAQELFNPNETESSKTIFQIQNKYIVSNIKSGMVFIHQNRAHQRILYERYLSELTVGEIASQQLLFPLSIALDTPDLILFKEIQLDLENSGFQFGSVSNEKIVITAAPTVVEETQITALIEEVITSQKEEIPQQSFSYFDFFAKILAKETAIKVGQSMTALEQEELVDTLFSCKEPMISPFSKSTYTTLTINDIDNRL
jgi:DNA mismatch repair protein MutL